MKSIRGHAVISWSVVWTASFLIESARFAFAHGSAVLGLIGTVSFAISSLALLYLGIRGIRRRSRVRLRNVAIGLALVVALLFVFQRAVDDGNQSQIEGAITRVFTSTDPSWCYDDVTWTYLEQTTHARRPFADDVCAQNLEPERRARSVEISEVNRSGGKATATVTPKGGTFAGSSLKLQIYHEDRWRVDRITGFESFDRAGYEATERALLTASGTGYPARSAECAIRSERKVPDQEIEQVLLGASPAGQLRLLISCDRRGFERLLTRHLADPRFRDVPATIASCVRRRVAGASADQLISYDTNLQVWGELFIGCDRRAYLRYYRAELLKQRRSAATADCVIGTFAKLSDADIARETADADAFDQLLSHCESSA